MPGPAASPLRALASPGRWGWLRPWGVIHPCKRYHTIPARGQWLERPAQHRPQHRPCPAVPLAPTRSPSRGREPTAWLFSGIQASTPTTLTTNSILRGQTVKLLPASSPLPFPEGGAVHCSWGGRYHQVCGPGAAPGPLKVLLTRGRWGPWENRRHAGWGALGFRGPQAPPHRVQNVRDPGGWGGTEQA